MTMCPVVQVAVDNGRVARRECRWVAAPEQVDASRAHVVDMPVRDGRVGTQLDPTQPKRADIEIVNPDVPCGCVGIDRCGTAQREVQADVGGAGREDKQRCVEQ